MMCSNLFGLHQVTDAAAGDKIHVIWHSILNTCNMNYTKKNNVEEDRIQLFTPIHNHVSKD